jgi:lysophospholipase L1-like esterase
MQDTLNTNSGAKIPVEEKQLNRLGIAALLLFSVQAEAASVLVWGDSISEGYTPDVAEDVQVEFSVRHIPLNGASTVSSLKHAMDLLHDRHYNVIVANWGLWDIAYRLHTDDDPSVLNAKNCNVLFGKQAVPLSAYHHNVARLARLLKAHADIVIFVSTTPVPYGEGCRKPEDVPRYNAVLEEIALNNGFAYLDTFDYIQPYVWALQRPENVHFTSEGYQILAYPVAQEIERQWHEYSLEHP